LKTVFKSKIEWKSKGNSLGFTLTEVVFAVFISALLSAFFFSLISTWRHIDKKANVQAELIMDGRSSMESIVRDTRTQMLGLAAANYTHGDIINALIIEADTDMDSVVDSLKGWGIQPMDDDGDGVQDSVVIEGRNGREATFLWELVEMTSSSTVLGSATWNVRVMCQGITAPWVTSDGHIYNPFEFRGSDLKLDDNNDGTVSESELGSFVTNNGIIDNVGEEDKISSVGIGIRLVKSSVGSDVESVLIYQGIIAPRNKWRESQKEKDGGS